MKKALNWLENNVQWLALGLGFLFVLYIVWTYVIQNPAKIQASPGDTTSVVDPNTVDAYIYDNWARKLSTDLHPSRAFVLPDSKFADLPSEPGHMLDAQPRPPGPRERDALALQGSYWNSLPMNLNVQQENPEQNIAKVQALPDTPPLEYKDTEFLRTVTMDAQGNHVDKDTVTTFWVLPVLKLGNEYNTLIGNKVPPGNQATFPLNAVLIRREKIGPGDDSWGPEQAVPTVSPLMTAPPPGPFPPPNPAAELNYEQWARNNITNILAPGFYTVAYANRPDLNWLTVDQLEAKPATPPPAVPTPPGPAGRSVAPAPAAPPVAAVPAPPAAPQFASLPSVPFTPIKGGLQQDAIVWLIDDSAIPGHTYQYKVRYTLRNPLYLQPKNVAKPELATRFGLDSPDSDWSIPITIPLRTRFWIAPHQPVMMADRTQMKTNFDVYTWHNGLWHYQPFVTVPGDEIGSDLSPLGDFTSHWTFLDLVNDKNGPRTGLVVADPNGSVAPRDITTDETSADYKSFITDYNAQPASPGDATPPPTPAAAAAAPGQGNGL